MISAQDRVFQGAEVNGQDHEFQGSTGLQPVWCCSELIIGSSKCATN